MTPAAAAAELLRRRGLRGSLSGWCSHALAPLGQAPARHHMAILQKLEALSRGDIDRLMILAPPGSAKSTYVSTLFPPWFMCQHRGASIIAASHTVELAQRFGRRVRNLIGEHSTTLGYALAVDDAAAGRWATDAGGEYFAVGVGGALSGRRADLLLIDDPVKSRIEADSPLISQRIWEWWQTDALTRLKPDGKVVLVQTRWAETDLGGRLEDEMQVGGKKWDILRLPMVAEADDPLGRAPGEMLWDEWFTADMLAQARRDTRTFSALYQQRPVPATGDYFRAEWLRPVASIPPRDSLRVYGASDYAVTSRGGDYTVHIVLGIDSDDRLWLLDMWRGQESSDVWVEAFCDLVLQWKPIGWAEETGQIRSGVGPFLAKRQRERRAFVARTEFPTRGDKAVRAQSIRGRMAMSGLHLPADAPWRADLEGELLSFPAGRHDDIADSLGLVGQLLDVMTAPGRTKPPEEPADPWATASRRNRRPASTSWKLA